MATNENSCRDKRHHLSSPLAWFILLFSLALVALFMLRGKNYHPVLIVDTSEAVSMEFVLRAQDNPGDCEVSLRRLVSTLKTICSTCRFNAGQCQNSLTSFQKRLLSDQAVSLPSAHMPNGVIGFSSQNPATAMAACEQSEKLAPSGSEIKCYAPDREREFFVPKKAWVDPQNIAYAFIVFVFAQLVSKLVCFLIIRYEHVHAHLSYDTDSGPQKFHAVPTPRIGGVALIMGLLVSSAVLTVLPQNFPDKEYGLLLLAAMPAFLGGLIEDVTKKVSVAQRLGLTMLSAGFGAWLLGGVLGRVDIPGVDALMQWWPLALAFTVFAVAGATNALNIIDGYNGLASGFAIIAAATFAFISARLGDSFLLSASLALVGAMLGFLVWNWPGGKIFLGDGGAYLTGFWLSEIAVLLVARHTELPVWFPFLVMIYPVFETLYSIYRRKIKRGQHPGHPDAMHLHQLIYCRVVRVNVGTRLVEKKIRRNSRVAPYFWILNSIFAVCAISLWRYPWALIALGLLFCVLYTLFYASIVSWCVPRFLIRKFDRNANTKDK